LSGKREMRIKTLACCRRRPQDFSIDMDQEPDRKHPRLPLSPFLPFLVSRARQYAVPCLPFLVPSFDLLRVVFLFLVPFLYIVPLCRLC
jgi:hypothetical protein